MSFEDISPFVRQVKVVSTVLLGILTCGFQLGYTSSLLTDLKGPDSPIEVDITAASWLASCMGPSNLVGFFGSSYLMDTIGRRKSFIAFSVPGILSWLLIYLAQDITLLMLGRVFGGISVGGIVLLAAIMIGEYSSPQHRGMFLNLKTTAICLGSMIIHILGHYFKWRTLAWAGMVVQAISLAISFTIPESPHWLAAKNRLDESRIVFYWLRGVCSQSKREINEIFRLHEAPQGTTKEGIFKKFTRIDFLKPLIIVLFGFILLESSGRHFFPAYASQLMEEITGNSTDTSMYTLGMDIIILLSTIASTCMVKITERRTLLFGTGFASVIVVFTASMFSFCISNGVFPIRLSGVTISLYTTYFILVNLGCTPIPLLLLGEIFPLKHRAAGSAAAGVLASFALWITVKALPYLLEALKLHGTFGLFGLIQIVSLFSLYFILPETKDRTLEEIEHNIKAGSFENENDEGEEDTKSVLEKI